MKMIMTILCQIQKTSLFQQAKLCHLLMTLSNGLKKTVM
nr:unnamed protein product [Callosobruchus chinensis]